MNQINTIKPYKWDGLWVFDDPQIGLYKEALVGGMPEIIDAVAKAFNIENHEQGFLVMFSKDAFPEANLVLEWVREEGDGNVYRWGDMEGWLCPALFKYFIETPAKIHIKAQGIDKSARDFQSWYEKFIKKDNFSSYQKVMLATTEAREALAAAFEAGRASG